MKNRSWFGLVVAAVLGAGLGLASCGEGECGVQGENCSGSYKEANGITYGCCGGLSCSAGASSGVAVCQ